MERMVNYSPYMSNVPYRTSLGEVALEIFLVEQSFFARPPAPVPLNGTQFLAASRNARLTERLLDHATQRLAFSLGDRLRFARELGGKGNGFPDCVAQGGGDLEAGRV